MSRLIHTYTDPSLPKGMPSSHGNRYSSTQRAYMRYVREGRSILARPLSLLGHAKIVPNRKIAGYVTALKNMVRATNGPNHEG